MTSLDLGFIQDFTHSAESNGSTSAMFAVLDLGPYLDDLKEIGGEFKVSPSTVWNTPPRGPLKRRSASCLVLCQSSSSSLDTLGSFIRIR